MKRKRDAYHRHHSSECATTLGQRVADAIDALERALGPNTIAIVVMHTVSGPAHDIAVARLNCNLCDHEAGAILCHTGLTLFDPDEPNEADA